MPSAYIIYLCPHRYELMVNCWKDKAEERPTFTDVVSRYHDGFMPGTSKAEHGDYHLLGSEENISIESAEESLNDISVVDVTLVNGHHQSTPSAGTTFHVTLLREPVGPESPDQPITARPDMDETNANVFVNKAVHEYDISDEGNHVTSSVDHVIPDVPHDLDYVLMQEAKPISQKY